MTPQQVSDVTYRPPDSVGPTLAVLLAIVGLVVAASYPVATVTALSGVVLGYLAGRFGPQGIGGTPASTPPSARA
jgi:hypothetical protein